MRIVTYDLKEFVELANLVEPYVRYEFRTISVSEYVEKIVFRLYAPTRDGNVVVYEDSTVVPRYIGAENAKRWIEERMGLVEKFGARPGRLE